MQLVLANPDLGLLRSGLLGRGLLGCRFLGSRLLGSRFSGSLLGCSGSLELLSHQISRFDISLILDPAFLHQRTHILRTTCNREQITAIHRYQQITIKVFIRLYSCGIPIYLQIKSTLSFTGYIELGSKMTFAAAFLNFCADILQFLNQIKICHMFSSWQIRTSADLMLPLSPIKLPLLLSVMDIIPYIMKYRNRRFLCIVLPFWAWVAQLCVSMYNTHMLLSCQKITKSFDGKDILRDVSFHIERNEKAAIVGINGAGKTTLLRIILQELSQDEGEITLEKGATIGYLAQNQNISSEHTILEELQEEVREVIDLEQELRDDELKMQILDGDELTDLLHEYEEKSQRYKLLEGYAWRSEVNGVARGLGFADEEVDKQISTLSGGQKTRVALGKLLLKKPDLIILDEPTNHLDMNSIRWLEGYLRNYNGAVLIVSHDRYFLDKIASKVIEIDGGKSTVFQGNYSYYSEKKAKLRAEQMHAYLSQQQEIRHQEEVIAKLRSYNREKSIKRAESREKMLDRVERLEKPTEIRDDMKITLKPSCMSGNDVLHVENLSKSFDDAVLFQGLGFDIRRGERVAIIGDNGTGKTTLLKIIRGMLDADSGRVVPGVKVHIGYYDQEHHVLHDELTLFEEISDAYPSMDNTEIRNTLAAFLFTGEDVFKRVGDLSGGEKGRMSLAKLMLSEANFLLLDEPTNHLDITSKEILEQALCNYEGTVLYVSHDRYFINQTATRILDLTKGQLVNYIGNYDYYLEHVEERMQRLGLGSSSAAEQTGNENRIGSNAFQFQSSGKTAASASAASEPTAGATDWKAQKEEQARLRKQQNELKKCEETISRLEEEMTALDEEMADPAIATDAAKLGDLAKKRSELETQLEALYEQWEQLSL